MIGSSFELSPEGLNTLKSRHTEQLDELNELQRGVFVDLGHVEGNQVVQSLDDLSGQNITHRKAGCNRMNSTKI